MKDFSFNNFVKLDSNQIALETIEDLFNSMKYGSVHNPIVILGMEGNGKSHLIQAIKKRIEGDHPTKKLKFLNPEILREEIRTIRKQSAVVTPIREVMSQLRLHENQILLFEDFHDLTPREETLRSIGTELGILLRKKHQLIITTSRTPQATWSTMYTMKDVFLNSTLVSLHTPILFRDRERLDNFFQEKYGLDKSSGILDTIYQKNFSSFKELEERVEQLLV